MGGSPSNCKHTKECITLTDVPQVRGTRRKLDVVSAELVTGTIFCRIGM
jgi:hypothetical protein